MVSLVTLMTQRITKDKPTVKQTDSKIKNYYVLHHFFYGCNKIPEQYVYEEQELFSEKMENYVSNHKFHGYPTEVYCFESKKWSLDDVLELEESNGWSPVYLFVKNGFKLVGEIDLIAIFDNNPKKARILDNGIITYQRHFTYDRPIHNLKEKKEEIQNELKKYNYENKNLIILRTSRSSAFAYWDDIVIFSSRRYNSWFYRFKINLDLITKEFRQFLNSLALIKQLGNID